MSRLHIQFSFLACLNCIILNSSADIFGSIDLPEYSLQFSQDLALRSELRSEIDTTRKNDIRYDNLKEAGRVASYELRLLRAFMASKGFYDAEIDYKINGNKIEYLIDAGERYIIEEIRFDFPQAVKIPELARIIQQEHQIEVGQPLLAENVLNARSRIFKNIARHYCFYRIEIDYKTYLVTDTKRSLIMFSMKDSPQVEYGNISFEGLETYESQYFMHAIDIETGKCFNRTRVDSAKLALLQTNLLVNADIDIAKPKDGKADIVFKVEERDRKTIKFGIGYDADDGFGVSTGWEHRNFTGRADKLNLDLYLAQRRSTLSTNWLLPHKNLKNRFARYWMDINDQDTDAYNEASGIFGVEKSLRFKHDYRFAYGIDYEYLDLDTEEESSAFNLVSLTASLDIDKRDDVLNPRDGWLVSSSVRPSVDMKKDDVQFVKFNVAAAAYYEFSRAKYSPVIALRAASGSIANGELEDVPISKRFFSGGGGSVRGYAFQSLSDFENGDPIGGLSYTEFAGELRFLFRENIGAAVFMDGGYAHRRPWPKADKDLLWGAGMGFRYYTSFAPIRFDIAVPLEKREDIDDDFQIYLSIGQSF